MAEPVPVTVKVVLGSQPYVTAHFTAIYDRILLVYGRIKFPHLPFASATLCVPSGVTVSYIGQSADRDASTMTLHRDRSDIGMVM